MEKYSLGNLFNKNHPVWPVQAEGCRRGDHENQGEINDVLLSESVIDRMFNY